MIWKDVRSSYNWTTLICRDTNQGLTSKNPADLLWGRCFEVVSPDEPAFQYSSTERGNDMAESCTLNPNTLAASRAWSSCMLQREIVRSERRHGELRALFEAQKAYTLHHTVKKKFPRNPYTVNNVTVIWECDLFDVQGLSKYTYGFKYFVSVINFSKYLHFVLLKSKKGPSVTLGFQLFLNPSARGHLIPSSYCDVGRFFLGVFKFWAKSCRSLLKIM